MRQPRDFIASILSDWLNLKECARFDTAMCQREGRAILTEIFQSGDVCHSGSERCIITNDCLRWLTKRGVCLRNLSVTPPSLTSIVSNKMAAEMVVTLSKNSRSSLRSLCLSDWGEEMTADHITQIAKSCPNVEMLQFMELGKRATRALADPLKHWKNLKEVDFNNCYWITDAAIICLAENNKELKRLECSYCTELTDKSIKSLAHGCPMLESFVLCECELITDIGHLGRGCKSLRKLDLSMCSKVTDNSIRVIATNCTSIEELYLHRCKLVTSETIIQLADNAPNLSHLSIAECNLVNDAAVTHLVSLRGEGILVLHMGRCPLLTDISLSSIADNCPALQHLRFDDNNNTTDASAIKVVEKCQNLTVFLLGGCKKITNAILEKLQSSSISGISSISYLSIKDCPRITKDAIASLKRLIPSVTLEYDSDIDYNSADNNNDDYDDDDYDDDDNNHGDFHY